MDERKEKQRSASKKKTAAASAGLIAGAAVLLSSLLPEAADIITPEDISGPPPVVLHLDGDELVDPEQAAPEEESKATFAERARQWILGIPLEIRTALVLPLWGLGMLVSQALSMLWAGLLQPAAGFLLSWLLGAAALLGTFGLGAKLMFPDVPFKKIFNKSNIAGLVGVALLLVAIDTTLPLFKPGYAAASRAVKAVGSLGIVTWLLLRFKKKKSATFP